MIQKQKKKISNQCEEKSEGNGFVPLQDGKKKTENNGGIFKSGTEEKEVKQVQQEKRDVEQQLRQ